MHKPNEIRVLALAVIQTEDLTFLSEGFDPIKNQTFYRALGGGVEFGETSLVALQREFQEEIQADLVNICYLGCLESIFSFRGQVGHEIIQLYRCDFADPRFYECDRLIFNEGKREKVALWVKTEHLRTGELLLVPQGCLDYLS